MHVAVHRLGQRCSGPLVQVVCGKVLRQTTEQGMGGMSDWQQQGTPSAGSCAL